MRIYFLRHADAEDRKPGGTDAERPLSIKGKRQSDNVARWLKNHGVEVEVVVTSPLLRARQTAETVAKALRTPLREDERLSGGLLTLDVLAQIIADSGAKEALLLVGHEPDFSLILAALTGGNVEVKKASAALVICHGIAPGEGELVWLVPPALQK